MCLQLINFYVTGCCVVIDIYLNVLSVELSTEAGRTGLALRLDRTKQEQFEQNINTFGIRYSIITYEFSVHHNV